MNYIVIFLVLSTNQQHQGNSLSKWHEIEKYLILFLQNEVKKIGIERVVFGLSGGIDSAVVALLCQKAFGEKALSVLMPSQYSSDSSIDDALELCQKHDLRYEVIPIGEITKPYVKDIENPLRSGNFCARIRMAVLFDISARESALVVGTSNKSELMLGYGTLFGDMASAINPIGDVYKSELYSFAKHLGVTEKILTKAPSADLYAGQSDEQELGYSYAELDGVIKLFTEERATRDEIVARGIDANLADFVIKKIYQNQFKRVPPIIAKLTSRTIGHDFLYPRDILT